MDVAAPGELMLSTSLDNLYSEANGTSQAAPLVASLLAFGMAHGIEPDMFLRTYIKPVARSAKIGKGIINVANMCDNVCKPTYDSLDYNGDGEFTAIDLRALLNYKQANASRPECADATDPRCCPP